MIAVIDATTQRGAVKGEELSTIGGLRDQCIRLREALERMDSFSSEGLEDEYQ